jgi:RND family efflux transporter MFP subunit
MGRHRSIVPCPNRLGVLFAAVLLAGCGPKHDGTAGGSHGPAATVAVLEVTSRADGPSLTLPARVRAREEVTVHSTLSGRVTALPFAEGQPFNAGDVLARFDAPEAREAIAAAKAAVEAAAVRVDLARRQEGRVDSLYAQGVASVRDVELVRSERQAAEAADAEARSSEASLLVGTAVPAPFAGVVVRHDVDPGASVAPGQALLDIRSSNAGEILAAVPEGAVSRLRGARVTFQVGDGAWYPAKLARIDGMTDFTTRTRNAWFVPSPGGPRLDPGAFARVKIELPSRASGGDGRPDQPVTIPSRCLVRRGGLSGVFVVRDGHAVLRWLRIGRADSLQTEVLAGLSPGERVVLDPGDLSDGESVTVRP